MNFLDFFSATSNMAVFRKLMTAMRRLVIAKYGTPDSGNYTHLVGIESKGFVLGPILALEWGLPFAAIRKKGKLPGECWQQSYTLEYGEDTMEMQKDAFPAGSKALIIDDLLATGCTMRCAEDLVANIPDSTCIGSILIFEIDCLKGRSKLTKPCETLIHLNDPEV